MLQRSSTLSVVVSIVYVNMAAFYGASRQNNPKAPQSNAVAPAVEPDREGSWGIVSVVVDVVFPATSLHDVSAAGGARAASERVAPLLH